LTEKSKELKTKKQKFEKLLKETMELEDQFGAWKKNPKNF
jgi:hypothetical protein